MTLWDGSGIALGSSSLVGGFLRSHFISSNISTSSIVEASLSNFQVFSGVVEGQGFTSWGSFVAATGVVQGASSLIGSSIRCVTERVHFRGRGLVQWSFPLPMRGFSVVAGHCVVDKHTSATSSISISFRYLQWFQRGDLSIFLCNREGPVSPVWVVFTLYQMCSGAMKRVGPLHRKPVSGNVGEFYAAGRAGESGQPGDWIIVWEWRHYANSVVQTKKMNFRVLDSVMFPDCSGQVHRKYGWS